MGLNKVKESLTKVNNKPIAFLKKNNWKEDDLLIQKELAQTLIRIKNNKRDGFYTGETADMIIKEINEGGGIITHEDLNKYNSIWRDPIVGYY